jgi:hypothetical protein
MLLSGDCPMAVWRGADNGSQMGVYRQIQETEAVTNVALRASEYLPARLECGIFIHPSRPEQKLLASPLAYGYPMSMYTGATGESNLPGIGAGLL